MGTKMLYATFGIPFATARVKYAPQKDRAGKVTKELVALTIINGSTPEIDVQRVWFLTSFNRPIFSNFVDSKMPVKVKGKDRATYLVPLDELKTPLNKNIGETIAEVVVSDKAERKYTGRVDKSTQAVLAN
jgi:hypothetical protein